MKEASNDPSSTRRFTLTDVAREAGVSIGTASRVINDVGSVGAAYRQRVLDAIQRLGYRPNAMAQSIRKPQTRLVGCIVRNITVQAVADFVDAACDLLTSHGMSTLISNSQSDTVREREILGELMAQGCDGVIISSCDSRFGLDGALDVHMSVPIVSIDRKLPQWADSVVVNHRAAISEATQHLLSSGHRNIRLLAGDPALYPARERIAGFQAALLDAGAMDVERMVRSGNDTNDQSYQVMSEILAEKDRPSAIIVGGTDMLAGVLRAIDEHGLKIPADISLIMSGDSDLARLRSPAINVESWSQQEAGRVAAKLLLDRINGRTLPPQHVVIAAHYIMRGSVAPVAG